MKIEWLIEEEDLDRIRELIKSQSNNPFVKKRIERTVDSRHLPDFEKGRFWEAMVACLTTTQQRAGPDSAVTRFCSKKPFPLSLRDCLLSANSLSHFVENTLTGFGGLRRTRTIGKEVEHNFRWLSSNGWAEIEKIANDLIKCRKGEPAIKDIPIERKAANFVAGKLKGFGPKQSRNLWQTLGLFRFEIPIDSRITKWLNTNGFPFKLSATALADNNYYEFVMDGIQELCMKCGVLPCILDAAIFSSFDQEWAEDKLIW
jgi:thermostable 8-oxoguanine DNA glycosylase